jgi:hypothetical protein
LVEAKYINLSLHHLEGVIIALQKEIPRPPSGRLTYPNGRYIILLTFLLPVFAWARRYKLCIF